jgi:hypothetical protein
VGVAPPPLLIKLEANTARQGILFLSGIHVYIGKIKGRKEKEEEFVRKRKEQGKIEVQKINMYKVINKRGKGKA